MVSSFFEDIDVLGMDFAPGQLIMVGGEYGVLHYLLSNCIMEGTKGAPGLGLGMLYFDCGCDFVHDHFMRLVVERAKDRNGEVNMDNVWLPPVYFDNNPNPSISYIVERIFNMVETLDISGVVINCLQSVTGGPLQKYKRECQLNGILSILKKLAEVLNLVIVVKAEVRMNRKRNHFTVDDFLDYPDVEQYCDQIILLDYCCQDYYELNLVKGIPGSNQKSNTVIKARLDSEYKPFRRAKKTPNYKSNE